MLAQDGSVVSSSREDRFVGNRMMLQNTKDRMLKTMDFDLMCDLRGLQAKKVQKSVDGWNGTI